MIDYDLELFDRIHAIADTIAKYGEKNFYVSFSGGKDSTVVSHLVDMAVPGNKIPRVFINTGIEYDAIVRFVKKKASKDGRFVILQPSSPIKKMLEEKGFQTLNEAKEYCLRRA
jgi:3'-phosphoadenosine 5'-phosphosulfate sulfotransferase (PAPS reductase)/FAD synthetase